MYPKMKNPPHPGGLVRDCLEACNLSVTAGAKALGVSRLTLNNLVNEHAGISPEMAVRLAKAFGSRAEIWLGIQLDYDLSKVNDKAVKVKAQRRAA